MKLWNHLRMLKYTLQLVRNPNRTEIIFKMIEIASHERDNPVVLAMEQKFLENDGFREMYQSWYVPDTPKMEVLAQLPDGSFGKLLHKHLVDHTLDLDLFPRFTGKTPIDYASVRVYQDHDLWHVLLGKGVSVEDEIEIQAFGVAQYQSPISTLLVAGGLLHLLLKDPVLAVQALGQAVNGYNLGKRAKNLLQIRLHDMFALPIEEVREHCGLSAA